MARLKLGDPIGELVRVVAVLLLVGGALALWMRLEARDREFRPDRHLSSDVRFQTDNAVGAKANAVEWIAKQTSPPLLIDEEELRPDVPLKKTKSTADASRSKG